MERELDFLKLDSSMLTTEIKERSSALLPLVKTSFENLKNKTCVGNEWTGWYDYPAKLGFVLAKEIKEYVGGIDFYYDTIVVIGIGGSYLGTKAVDAVNRHTYDGRLALGHSAKKAIVYAGHNVSESELIELLEFLRNKNPIINVVSKSGTTTESGIAFRILRNLMEDRYGKDAVNRIVVTTDPQSGALRALANKFGYRCFPVPPDMGGRYSVLSAVGLVPLALAGHDIEGLLEGAESCFRAMEILSPELNPVLQYAAARVACYQSGKSVEVLSLSEPKMAMFGEWWKQLFGESEGKNGQGIFPAVTTFTTDLHSLGQYLQDGKQIFFETFLSIESLKSTTAGGLEQRLRIPKMPEVGDGLGYLEGKTLFEINCVAMQATRIAHREAGVPCLEIMVRTLDPYCLGGFIAFMEIACAVSALSIGVNPFDQPGVEAYKNNLFALLGKPGFEGLGARLRSTY